jgi:hypothetical protein
MKILRAQTQPDNTHAKTARATADWLAKLGICVIPIGSRTKTPFVKWEQFQTRLPTEQERWRWWGGDRGQGVAIVLGEVSGNLASRDFDVAEAYDRWRESHPELAATLPTVRTRRGFHVYFRVSEAFSALTVRKLGDGELRVSGCFNLAPPSQHPDGGRYEWVREMLPLTSLPILDPYSAGLATDIRSGDWTETTENTEPTENTERTERTEPTENTEATETTEAIKGGVGCFKTNLAPESPILRDRDIAEVIAATLPEATGQREGKLFMLARRLKGMPAFADAPVQSLKPIVREWHRQALPVIGTKPFEETWFAFARGWGRVKFPAGEDPIDQIVAKCRELPPPKCADEYEQPALKLLVTILRELARSQRGGMFFLSCRTGARHLGEPRTTVAVWLKGLVVDEVLSVVEAGSARTMKATRYRYMPPLDA